MKPFWILGIDRTVQNVVGIEEYGFYFSLFNLSLLLNMVLDVGITSHNQRTIARSPHLLKERIPALLMVKGILGLVYGLVCLVVALSIGYGQEEFRLLYWLMLNQFLASLILFLRSNISGLQKFSLDSLLSVLDRFLMILICALLLWGGFTNSPFHISWFVYAQTGAYATTAVIVFLLVLRQSGRLCFRWRPKLLRDTLHSAFPYALMALLMASYTRIDSVMLERMLPDGDYQAGIYAQAFRLLDAAAMVGYLFAGILMPMYARMIQQGKSIVELLRLSALMLIVPALLVVAGSVFYNQEIMELLYTETGELSARVFAILMSGYLPVCLVYIFSTLLTANGNLREMNITAGLGVLVNILLNVLLIPQYKAAGSALASIITQSAVALLYIYWVCHKFSLRADLRILWQLAFWALLLIIFGLTFKWIHIQWIAEMALLLIMGLATALAIRLVRIKSFLRILSPEEE